MKTDTTIDNIFADIKAEMKEEFDVDISIAEINDIASSQFDAAIFAFAKGVEVRLSHFGRICRSYKVEAHKLREYLNEIKDKHGEEAYKKEKRRVQDIRIEDRKRRSKNRRAITLEELLDAPYSSDVSNPYQKLNNGKKLKLDDFHDLRRRAIIDKLQGS